MLKRSVKFLTFLLLTGAFALEGVEEGGGPGRCRVPRMSPENSAACREKIKERREAYAKVYGGGRAIWRFLRLEFNCTQFPPHLASRDTPNDVCSPIEACNGTDLNMRRAQGRLWGEEGITYLRGAVATNLLDDLVCDSGRQVPPERWREFLACDKWRLLYRPWSPAIGEISKALSTGLFFPRVYLTVLELLEKDYSEHLVNVDDSGRQVFARNRECLVESLLKGKSSFKFCLGGDECEVRYRASDDRDRVMTMTLSGINIYDRENVAWLCFILLAIIRITDELVKEVRVLYAKASNGLYEGVTQEWLIITFCEARQIFDECKVAYDMQKELYRIYRGVLRPVVGMPIIPNTLKRSIELRNNKVKRSFSEMIQELSEDLFSIKDLLDFVEPPLLEAVEELIGHSVVGEAVDSELRRQYQPAKEKYCCEEF